MMTAKSGDGFLARRLGTTNAVVIGLGAMIGAVFEHNASARI